MTADEKSHWESRLNSANVIDVLGAMDELVEQGDAAAIPLLHSAGSRVGDLAKRLPITLPDGKYTFEQFRERAIRRLKERIHPEGVQPESSTSREPRVFISYNHRDREAANSLALELSRAGVSVFIDHWEMAASDRILEQIEKELHGSDFVIVVLSPRSIASTWVRTELKYAYMRQEKEGREFLIPVLFEDCHLPPDVAERPYHDWRREQDRPAVVQAIVNHIQGVQPFSKRVKAFLAHPDDTSPYTSKAQGDARRLLLELAKYPEMEIANNQRWLLWELFHHLLEQYTCTLKVGPAERSQGAVSGVMFLIVDRWNEKASGATLTAAEFAQGLWAGEVDLLKGGMLGGSQLKHLGRQGRFSWGKAYNPNVESNPAEPSAKQAMSRIMQELQRSWEPFDGGARQCFLFDYQRLVIPAEWHKIKFVVGSGPCDMTLAYSHLLQKQGPDKPGEGAIFEIYDPFFGSLKATQLFTTQLNHQWEGDVDLMSSEWETLLGLA